MPDKNIVILVGSPRKNGNTTLLAQAFAEKASIRNHVEMYHIAELNIAPCQGCNICFSNGNKCVQKDDMQEIYKALALADMLVIASPVYFYGISAQLTACINRLHNPLRDSFHIRNAALLLAAASHKPYICDAIKLQYQMLLKNFDIENSGMVIAQGVKEVGDIANTEYLVQAQQLGQQV